MLQATPFPNPINITQHPSHNFNPSTKLNPTHRRNSTRPDPSTTTTTHKLPFFPVTEMATARPRTAGLGAVRRQSMRVYNEPFTPNVVERDDNEAHILQLELPEFSEQHVKVKVEEEARMVVVTGDRLVANNRLLILNKTYPIPQFCVIDQIHHKLEAGFLTITMPKQASAPAVETAAPPPLPPKETEQTTPEKKNEKIPPENAAPVPKQPEQTNPEKGIEKPSPGNAAPATKKTEQTTPEKGSEKLSPEKAAPATKKTEQTTPEKGSEKLSPENAAPATKKTEQTTPEKGSEETSPGIATPPAAKTEITEEPDEEVKEEKAPTPAPAVAPPPAAAERDSGRAKMKADEKIGSPNQNPTEKKEIENGNREKGKESKAEAVGKREETAKIGTGASPPRATGVGKLAGRCSVGRLALPVTASVTAAVVTVVAAYFAFAYYGLSFAME